jgi:2-polyprenyl-3-methyl-5-hydroxy-6-metoxy-1,4-benzoquinol methylase
MQKPASAHDVTSGDRFAFGANWSAFLRVLDDERIQEAQRSLRDMLGRGDLDGLTFLDAGCGSGLFSLAAVRLGARRVRSFDYDPRSVECTLQLRRRYAPGAEWTVEQGDALDGDYVRSLGRFDVVYSWGVLHHTGNMWMALDNVAGTVTDGGRLFIAI